MLLTEQWVEPWSALRRKIAATAAEIDKEEEEDTKDVIVDTK